ncbi:MAG: hypothetical protein V1775_11325 [Bacteroidota bacterium]
MRTLLTTLFVILILITGCNKDEYPDEFYIIGTWIELTADTSKVEIEFRNGNPGFLKTGTLKPIDTLRYKPD